MQKSNLLFGFTLFFVLVGELKAQVDPLSASVTFLQDYTSTKAPEKVYLYTDRPYYASGENVWFTAWVMDAVSHKGLETSQMLYVQLLNSSGSVVLQRVLRVQDGQSKGDLYLPQDLETGTYVLRAYTPWMMNFDARWYFRKQIPVINPKQKPIEKKSMPRNEQDKPITFYPEGGSLLAGIDQRVAFTLSDVDNFTGGILETEEGTNIGTVSLSVASMGVISFTPVADKTYYARLIFQDRTERVQLPEVKPYGMALSANMIDSTAFELVIRPVSLVSDVTLIGHARGKPVFSGTAAASPEGFRASILRKDLPTGITEFLLFDSNGDLLGKRLLFNPPQKNNVTISVDQTVLTKRSSVNVSLSSAALDSTSRLALRVVEESKARNSKDYVDLEAYVYLMSDLHRPISQLSYYLKTDQTTRLHADLLMMTQTWERFDGSEIAKPSKVAEERVWITDNIALKGKIQQKRNQKAITNEVFTLIIDPENPTYYPIKTDAEGRFELPNLSIPDSVAVVADGDNKGGRRPFELVIDPIHSPIKDQKIYYAIPALPIDSIPSDFAVKAYNRIVTDQSYGLYNQVRTLGEVIVQAKVEPKPTVKESNNRIYGVADRTFIPSSSDLSRGGNVLDFLKGKTGAFRITGSGSGTRVTFARAATLTSTTTPLFFVDGIETDVTTVARINIQNVGAVDILTEVASTSIFGARGSNGVISVFTFVGEREVEAKPDIVSQKAPGFHQERAFYAPDYSIASDLHKKPDTRSTLWWSPLVSLNPPKERIRFYTSDEIASYTVEAVGISVDGKVYKGSSSFIVR